jgi:histidinol-phosphate phosphatase family protein
VETERKKFAVFLDRDGTINREVGNLHKLEDLEILPGVGIAISLLNKKGIPVVVVTNQSVIARGWCSEEELQKIHEEIQIRIRASGAHIDAFYYCPHHVEGVVVEFKKECDCRKPAIGMLMKAAKDLDIELSKSYIIGDSYRDMEAGRKVGSVRIAVDSGAGGFRKNEYDYRVSDLPAAINIILQLFTNEDV